MCVNICMCAYISLTVSVCLLVVVLDCAVVDFPPARIIRPVCNLNIIMRFFDICICCAWCLEWHVTFSPATKSIEIVNVHVRSCSRSLFPHISFAFTFTFRFVCWFVHPLSGISGDHQCVALAYLTNATASQSHPRIPPHTQLPTCRHRQPAKIMHN